MNKKCYAWSVKLRKIKLWSLIILEIKKKNNNKKALMWK